MNRVEIYRDDKIKVEIDGFFHNFIDSLIIKTIKLSAPQHRFLVEMALDILTNTGINYKDCIVKVSSKAPVIEYNKRLSLIEPFTIFEYAYDLLVYQDDWIFNEIKELIIQHYKKEEIPFHIERFKHPKYKINGFLAAKYENELLISFFSINEDENIVDNY